MITSLVATLNYGESSARQLMDGLVTWASVLEVTKIRQQDFTSYRCSARNSLGSDSIVVHLRPPSRPLPPLHLSVSTHAAPLKMALKQPLSYVHVLYTARVHGISLLPTGGKRDGGGSVAYMDPQPGGWRSPGLQCQVPATQQLVLPGEVT